MFDPNMIPRFFFVTVIQKVRKLPLNDRLKLIAELVAASRRQCRMRFAVKFAPVSLKPDEGPPHTKWFTLICRLSLGQCRQKKGNKNRGN